MTWEKVCSPKWDAGLGIINLRWLNISMQERWPWLQRTNGSRPWSEFEIEVPRESPQLYNAATHVTIGDGTSTLFWKDQWLDGLTVQDLAPSLHARVNLQVRSTRLVSQAFLAEGWARDIGLDLNAEELHEFSEHMDATIHSGAAAKHAGRFLLGLGKGWIFHCEFGIHDTVLQRGLPLSGVHLENESAAPM